ncbi:MAG: selenium-dependent xanthine dehydrogenase [Candidatus Heimdallarchaeum aukensis]|uniref:Selenium-dependent xanthine dehydrogenase n=1 Tax=Candidatus Heimdallarchaeum aukensis TaxID=2876573 RepID=A0A9Y1BKL4_9ARCH|nr:MAG: selenium-dependent xanthine dehydrogenase [Candidatus Heimdallarchaeum aukensis]
MKETTFILNGEEITIEYEEGMSLLDVLREKCDITSCKDGCSGQGYCGACTVLIDGKAMTSCNRDPSSVEGKNIITIEGLEKEEKLLLANALVKEGGIQCGFCTPGIMLRIKSFLDTHPKSTREEKARALSPNLCRCTGYQRIIDAIETAEEHWKTKTPVNVDDPPRRADFFGEKYGLKREYEPKKDGVGYSTKRYRGLDMALGQKPYIADMKVEGMLHGAFLLSEHPRAVIKKIDLTEAEKACGVVKILTAKDVPGKRFIGHIIPDWPIFVDEGETTRYVGDVIAMVVADSMFHARAAVEKIKVEYEVLEPLDDPIKAMDTTAEKIHESGNILSRTVFSRGDVEEAFRNSKYFVKQEFRTQRIEHAFLEVEASLALPTDKGVHVYSQGQGVHEDQRQIAEVLGLEKENVIVELVTNGGAFGGKEDLSVQAQTALAAYLLKKPVKTVLTREQSLRMHPKRHPMIMRYEVGADENGKLTGARIRIIGDTGAYASVGGAVVERAAGHSCGPYYLPAIDVDATAVYTNNPPCGAMRGFGVNQTSFAIETCLNMIAAMMRDDGKEIDDFDIRERNILREGKRFATGQIMTKTVVGLQKCLDAVKEQYKNYKGPKGIACGIKNTGIGNALEDTGRVLIRVLEDERLEILTGFTEMGQGLFTVLTQAVSELTNIHPSKMDVKSISYDKTKCGMTTASRATALDTMAAKYAAEKLAEDLKNHSPKELVGKEYHGEYVTNITVKPGTPVDNPITHLAFSYAVQVAFLDENGKLKKILAAHDVGRAVNPLAVAGQIEGGIHMGLGHTLSEDFPTTKSVPVSLKIRDLQILKAKDTPEIEVIIIEEPEEIGGFGAKGVGEIGLVPTAGAVTGAFYQYDGKWRTELPIARKKR